MPSIGTEYLHFEVTPLTVRQMVIALEACGLIERTPGAARSIRVFEPRELLPDLS